METEDEVRFTVRAASLDDARRQIEEQLQLYAGFGKWRVETSARPSFVTGVGIIPAVGGLCPSRAGALESDPMQISDPMQRCGRRNRDGTPCRNWPIEGATVCRMHGGSAPQVRAKAQERIQALVAPALARIEHLIGDIERSRPGAENENVALAAARDILDRAGYSATHRVEMSGEMTVVSPVDLELEEIAARLEKARENVETEDA